MRDVGKTRIHGGSSFELQVPDFSVTAGQLVALVGPSGCGKSTLLDIIALVMAPTRVGAFEMRPDAAGPAYDVREFWARADEASLAGLRRDYLGYVLQTGGLLPFLNVRDNVALPARIKGSDDALARLELLAERLGVADTLDRMPDSLSIGQRQRVAILRALAPSPRLVLADEPTAAVDRARARAIMDDMQSLAREEDVAVLLVTHDVDLVEGRADLTYTFETEQLSEQVSRSVCRRVDREAA
jgi:putative ABC transport system ATP-binding protein